MIRRLLASVGLAAALAIFVPGAPAEVIEHEPLVIVLDASLSPGKLPRDRLAPVSVSAGAAISTTDGSRPPTLRRVELAVNRHGRLSDRGLATCPRRQLERATSREALAACRDALVGRGRIIAQIALPEQAPLPSDGRLLAFNGRVDGLRAILAHVYGETPLPVTAVVTFLVRRTSGRYGTNLSAEFPSIASDWGYVSSFELALGRRYRHRSRPRSYLSASCPAPNGFPGATFSLARGTYTFEDGTSLTGTIERDCSVR